MLCSNNAGLLVNLQNHYDFERGIEASAEATGKIEQLAIEGRQKLMKSWRAPEER